MLTYLDSAGTALPYVDDSTFEQKCLFCEKHVGRPRKPLYLFESPLSDAKFSFSWKNVCKDCYVLGPQQLEHYRNCLNKRGLRVEVIHKGDGTFMTNRLKEYLDSEASRLPSDYEQYRKGGKYEDMCVFCKNSPADYPIYQHVEGTTASNPGRVKIPTQTYACVECFSEAKELYIDHGSAQAQLFDTEPFATNGEVGERMRRYVVEGSFVEEVHLYLQHRTKTHISDNNTHNDPSISPLREHCYFCGVYTPNNFKLLDVPVRVSNYFTGGVVRYCKKSCEKRLHLTEMAEPVVTDISVRTRTNKCRLCHKEYLVDIFEHRMREAGGTIDMHMCPSCTYKTNFYGEESTLFGERDNKELRYSECTCDFCSTEFQLDLTLSRSYIKRKYVSSNHKICCPACKYHGMFPIFVTNVELLSATKIRCYNVSGRYKPKMLIRYFRDTELVSEQFLAILPEEIIFKIYDKT